MWLLRHLWWYCDPSYIVKVFKLLKLSEYLEEDESSSSCEVDIVGSDMFIALFC